MYKYLKIFYVKHKNKFIQSLQQLSMAKIKLQLQELFWNIERESDFRSDACSVEC